MKRRECFQGIRLMKFEEVYGRPRAGTLSQEEAAEILGVSERTFRRWWGRFEIEGADGLYDRRLGKVSARTSLPSQAEQLAAILTMKSAASPCCRKLSARSWSTSSDRSARGPAAVAAS